METEKSLSGEEPERDPETTLMMGVPIILSESEIFSKHHHFPLIGYMLVTRLSNHWYELPSGQLGKDEVGGSNPPSSSIETL